MCHRPAPHRPPFSLSPHLAPHRPPLMLIGVLPIHRQAPGPCCGPRDAPPTRQPARGTGTSTAPEEPCSHLGGDFQESRTWSLSLQEGSTGWMSLSTRLLDPFDPLGTGMASGRPASCDTEDPESGPAHSTLGNFHIPFVSGTQESKLIPIPSLAQRNKFSQRSYRSPS